MQELVGTGVALITPFNSDLTVDHTALAKIVDFNIENGTDYLVISGTTGESVTISATEKKEIITTVKAANRGRVPMVIGIGGNNTAQIVEELNSTDLDDFTAILSVAPYYSKPTQEGFYQHFKTVAEASSIPVILYNVPGRTAKNMEPKTTLRLARDFDTIVAVKEAGNNTQQYLELIKNKPDDFLIISGDDDLALGAVLAGGSGVISVIGQAFPKAFSEMINLGLKGQAKEAYVLHYQLMDLINLIFSENNPAGIKSVMSSLGLCKSTVRLPLVEATSELKEKIKQAVDTLIS
ncbi:MAG: 4-hydroxy-tetrahydrodipicolinate synthase [Bacteroidia bacterium]|nr:4-hydroxy-tetrahydrodipicolinate synthase [Bacteroidia bacterium]MBT8278092.1 4-hydroxy-tetrahydrodipicolinate synthase [Bacteroidia bacterium]NND26336.1 4-hydroxy-tetrahydrodipicolinate synthase [Flavobacteriaceae bacterium]NNK59604.1 4-hydroxy-tetrahydrodipicolinate synthase [Flavobacteriaceae bacterium]RZW55644.1 MAG: 4-hydroxy-tetrahydrodipicolinate synthase [Flavobacteriaceae bacterium]